MTTETTDGHGGVVSITIPISDGAVTSRLDSASNVDIAHSVPALGCPFETFERSQGSRVKILV